MAQDPKTPKSALVLSGGGARGAYEAGVVSQLYANGESFDIVCGTSIGAINGALIAQCPMSDTLKNIWTTISQVGVITEIPLVKSAIAVFEDIKSAQSDGGLKKIGDLMHALGDAHGIFPLSQFLALDGLLEPSPVSAFLKAHLNFSQICLPYIFAATNLTHGASQVFFKFPDDWSGKDHFVAKEPTAIPLSAENYLEAVRSSGAIPIAFPPVAIPALPAGVAGSHYVDGGVANNTPIGQAIDAGALRVTVIFMDPATDAADHYPTANVAQIAAACYSVMSQTILQQDFELALRTNTVARNASNPKNRRVIELRYFRPSSPLPLTILDFDKQDSIDRAFALGVADANVPVPFST